MRVFKREKYEACSQIRPLTSIVNTGDDSMKLIIHNELRKDYLSWWHSDLKVVDNNVSQACLAENLFFQCCYQRITRSGQNASADNEVHFSDCKTINSSHLLNSFDEFIMVWCSGFRKLFTWKPSSVVYRNAHAIIRKKSKVAVKLARELPPKGKISVFMMGIDSISRLNLIRGMPETYKYLEDEGWFEMRGFNKIGDNTHPNLMAILTGQNETVNDQLCNWRNVGELEKCDFIWNDYNASGYVTAYAEDKASINTFNYYETGFVNEPTDYYLRPFTLGAEKKLNIKKKHGSMMCLGYQHYADHIYQYGLDFAVMYKDDPSFGLFWTNSFSHEDLSMSSAMDTRVVHYLNQLKTLGILDSSIVMFFSDHGMRFGPIRNHFIGWLEERLPFFFIWLPQSFQKTHPEIVKNLKINRDRLTSPYDVYLTLKDILRISGRNNDSSEVSAVSCPDCQSLFEELSFDRSCSDAGVTKHWCTCVKFEEIDKTSEIVKTAVNYVVKSLNSDLSAQPKCAKLKLNEIHSAQKSTQQSSVDYLVSFNVQPSSAQLEATVRCGDEECKNLSIIGSISRLNRYGNQSHCVSDSNLRKYCFCK